MSYHPSKFHPIYLWKNDTNFKTGVLSVVYGLFSVAMVFINKVIYQVSKTTCTFMTPLILLIIQCLFCWIFLLLLAAIPNFNISLKITKDDFKSCIIMNCVFIITMLSNNYSLKFLSVHMVTLLKCCSVVVTAIGERIILKNHLSLLSWISLFLIVLGSSFGLLTNIEFSLPGYISMSISVISASLYNIIAKRFISLHNINHFAAAFWNNLLSFIFLSIYALKDLFGSSNSQQSFSMCSSSTMALALFSGLLSLFLIFSTFSLLGHTSATSYAVVGAAKKVIQALFSFIFWSKSTTVNNMISVMIGFCGSIMYTYSKMKEQKRVEADAFPLLKDRNEAEP